MRGSIEKGCRESVSTIPTVSLIESFAEKSETVRQLDLTSMHMIVSLAWLFPPMGVFHGVAIFIRQRSPGITHCQAGAPL